MAVFRFLAVAASGVLLLGLGGFAVSQIGAPSSKEVDGETLASLQGEGVLDDKVFRSRMGPAGQPADVEDNLVFRGGLFASSECEARCDYPARPYFTRSKGGAVHFVSETKCPFKDAKIVWRGVVRGERVSGQATWTLKRWYWSIERTFWFEGELIDDKEVLAQTIPLAPE